MSPSALCAICHKRKAKRDCPGVRAAICAICCGREREVSVDCPLDCFYLRESRRYDLAKAASTPPEMPFPETEIADSFLNEHAQLIGQLSLQLLRHALENPRVVDHDILEALDKLVRTFRTQESGIYYESLPENPPALGIFRSVSRFLAELQEKERERGSLAPLKTADLIRSLVFLARLATVNSNRRPRGRAFIDFLRQMYPQVSVREEPRLVVPGQ